MRSAYAAVGSPSSGSGKVLASRVKAIVRCSSSTSNEMATGADG